MLCTHEVAGSNPVVSMYFSRCMYLKVFIFLFFTHAQCFCKVVSAEKKGV